MREDMRHHRPSTEIEYINGYIVRRGEEVGIKCACHFMVMQMVKARGEIDQRGEKEYVPFNTSRVEGKLDVEKLGRGEEGGVTIEDAGRGMRERGRSN